MEEELPVANGYRVSVIHDQWFKMENLVTDDSGLYREEWSLMMMLVDNSQEWSRIENKYGLFAVGNGFKWPKIRADNGRPSPNLTSICWYPSCPNSLTIWFVPPVFSRSKCSIGTTLSFTVAVPYRTHTINVNGV